MPTTLPMERITSKIYFIREQNVMLDRDLAELCNVETRTLVQAVKRKVERFPYSVRVHPIGIDCPEQFTQ